ncbi:hypothetical protein INS49_002039 [Diaporthe citri]|uniref:uncharacterized protein n=1 Tax=Diaporthe citri TaxID=83186 RepID=UPI001C7E7AF0|nr:uncharacterized protein INS49_002039 [Diaporthe citri]KAG6367844.1 hypothetical protein INS49_002039 [Diaporthe citri]
MRNLHTSRTSSSKEPASSSGRMPYDRSSTAAPSTSASASTTSSRHPPPLHPPSLAKRLPVTPKLAGKPAPTSTASTSASASQRQTVTLATPVPRRSTRPSSVVSHASHASHATTTALQNNATPRSGSRQSRVTSANASPSPADAAAADHWETRSGLGISGTALDSDAGTGALQRSETAPTPRESKFFYASDASRTAQAAAPGPRPALPQKGPTFFYANGNNLPPKPSPPTSVPSAPFSPPLASSTPDSLASKFMYANGSPDLQPSLMKSGSGSAHSANSRMTSSKHGAGSQSPAPSSQRMPSPAKATGYPPPPPQPQSQSQYQSQPSAGPSIAERRSMITSAPQLGPVQLQRFEACQRGGRSQEGAWALALRKPGGRSSTGATRRGFDPKSASGNDPLNELVANARRERKVQDLQITNASLEAINRTLERQLRKQTNELRRYKRLTRAGRLSSANTAASSRIPSTSTASEAPEGPLNNLGLTDLNQDSGTEPDDESTGESELSESDSAGSAQMSPSTIAMRDAQQRKRDEKRLQVDLSKHQQLLVDSQKMNQSLKRCLGWTEELIREGKRALDYQVRVSEFDVDGRAVPEESNQPYIYDGAQLWDHASEQRRASSDSEYGQSDGDADRDPEETMKLRIERLRPAEQETGAKSTQDRDSGIVLSGDGS